MLVDALGSPALAEKLGFSILTKSDGNPFFVFEILRDLRDHEYIASRDGGEYVQLRDLVDTMLGPNQRPQIRVINVHEVLEHVRHLLQAEVGDSINVIRDYDPSMPDIRADRAQLVQALLNIVRNAMQATAANEGERIIRLRTRIQRQFTIGCRRHRLVCRLDIEDKIRPPLPGHLT